MKKHTGCGEGTHQYGPPTAVGGGLLRAVCETCETVQIHITDEPVNANDLFSAEQRHLLFSPLVEYAATYGHELLTGPSGFGTRRDGKRSPVLVRA